jgi:hypothetical protein
MGSIKVKVTEGGTEKIADIGATVLRLDITGSKAVWYVNPLDGKVLRTVVKVPSATGMIDQIVDYSDWRVCDGLTVPFQRATTQGTQVSQETINNVEFNPDVSGQEPATTPVAGTQAPIAPWQRGQKTDPLRGITYAQFSLVGKFLTPPEKASNPNPVIIVRCTPGRDKKGGHGYTNGKFSEGYILVGGVMDSSVAEGGDSFVSVNFRLDDGKLQSEQWGRSTDFSAIFFSHPTCPLCGRGYDIFANLLYGHAMYHKENTNPQVRKVVIGVSEYLGSEVVMQFDMPDATEVAEACGIIMHK